MWVIFLKKFFSCSTQDGQLANLYHTWITLQNSSSEARTRIIWFPPLLISCQFTDCIYCCDLSCVPCAAVIMPQGRINSQNSMGNHPWFHSAWWSRVMQVTMHSRCYFKQMSARGCFSLAPCLPRNQLLGQLACCLPQPHAHVMLRCCTVVRAHVFCRASGPPFLQLLCELMLCQQGLQHHARPSF